MMDLAGRKTNKQSTFHLTSTCSLLMELSERKALSMHSPLKQNLIKAPVSKTGKTASANSSDTRHSCNHDENEIGYATCTVHPEGGKVDFAPHFKH
jgi:hypothetical protein